ncbi:MAG: hypothetical protein PQ964_01345 [Methanobacteriaceae archaeon]|jgi:hypothetical protein
MEIGTTDVVVIGWIIVSIIVILIDIYRIKYSQKMGILQSLRYYIKQERKIFSIACLKKNIKYILNYMIVVGMVSIGVMHILSMILYHFLNIYFYDLEHYPLVLFGYTIAILVITLLITDFIYVRIPKCD